MAHQGLQQVQKQAQTLVLAPQLRQSLKILQAATLELRNSILEELQQNPTLEELPIEGISLEQETSEANQEATDNDNVSNDEMQLSEEDYSKLSQLDEDYREYYTQEASNSVYTSEDAQRRQHFFDSLVSETSLQEHLIRQADLCDMTPTMKEGVDYLIGSLDDRGFLTTTLSDAALMTRLPLQDMQAASDLLKTLDPPGIGTKDLQDCLLTQLELMEREDTLAAEIIRDHYELLLRHRIPDIARKAGASVDEIQFAIEEIAALDPAPGSKFSDDNNRVVVPDVTVEKQDDTWVIILNNDYIPRLRISPAYKEMIATGKIVGKDKEYIREKIRAGRFLMNSIEQRQQTIERITEEILKYQLEFFEHGVSKLRPLTMNQIAQTVGVHETTVSRAIANKFIETPHGVFEFKYFFTPGYQGKNGQSVSNKSIKDRIAHIIGDENPAKPLSDQEVVKILAEEDVKIARRTVAKYREELGILPTNLRRRFH
ncbi:RNA polymerase factor sigma-54 [Cerasicoccus arenae]|uniref:RNA polymerase sigma-54 factor n=1 Tax=Cerasicoccus arenae TaxID=424488 RepID=A0A8J3DJ99_9BACT|nr:RNA polymerase factor sigma-54 [Cerasicoccus arenae]MBK1857890.1 RNA polymerase factor sigma-54 [Cerasicoccus arenae]GHC09488.1 RNA polymerase sigma-54 factor [Cerasicoccus arenae]